MEGREENERQNVKRVSRWVLVPWGSIPVFSLGGRLRVQRWHGHVLHGQHQEDSNFGALLSNGRLPKLFN